MQQISQCVVKYSNIKTIIERKLTDFACKVRLHPFCLVRDISISIVTRLLTGRNKKQVSFYGRGAAISLFCTASRLTLGNIQLSIHTYWTINFDLMSKL